MQNNNLTYSEPELRDYNRNLVSANEQFFMNTQLIPDISPAANLARINDPINSKAGKIFKFVPNSTRLAFIDDNLQTQIDNYTRPTEEARLRVIREAREARERRQRDYNNENPWGGGKSKKFRKSKKSKKSIKSKKSRKTKKSRKSRNFRKL